MVTENAAKPTQSKDETLYDTGIFGFDISRRVLHPQTEFTPAPSRYPALISDNHKRLITDDPRMSRMLTREMLSYYGIACLWARIIDVKAKRENTPLTDIEREFYRYFRNKTYALPAPLLVYLRTWGHFRDQRGTTCYISQTIPFLSQSLVVSQATTPHRLLLTRTIFMRSCLAWELRAMF